MLRRTVKFEEAERYLASRADRPTSLTANQYLATWDRETRQKAFFSARVASADILSELHRRANDVVQGRMSEAQAAELLSRFLAKDGAGALQAMGFAPVGPAVGDRLTELGSTRRLKLIIATNARIAEEAGHYQQWAQNADIYPYGRWRLGPSEEHRPEHVARDGKVYPFDHPIWRQSPPGSEFGCQCWREQLTAEQARAAGVPIEPRYDVPRGTVDFDPARGMAEPPPVKADMPAPIREQLQSDIRSAPTIQMLAQQMLARRRNSP